MRRNTLVLGITLFVLAALGWAGWANWEYRKQAAEKRMAMQHMDQPQLAVASMTGMDMPSPLLHKPAPNFTLQNLSGKEVSLSSYKGKALLINFWATWCGPCKLETPWLVELHKKYAPKGFEIIGISAEGDDLAKNDTAGWAKDKAAIARFVQQEHMPYPVLINGDSISQNYGGLDSLPTSFFVDRKGVVVATQIGITSEADMAAKIQKALND